MGDTGPGPSALQERIPTKWRVVKQEKCLLGGNRVQYVWIDTQAASEGESLSLALMTV